MLQRGGDAFCVAIHFKGEIMMGLFKGVWSVFGKIGRGLTILRNILINVFFFGSLLFSLLIFYAVYHEQTEPVAAVSENRILKLNLAGDIVEERRQPPGFDRYIEEFFGMKSPALHIVLRDVCAVIEGAAEDPSVVMLVLNQQKLGAASIDQLKSIGEAINYFKKNGKKVVASQDFYSQKHYLLASYADTVVVNPMGGVEMRGFGSYSLYFKSLLEKLKVQFHIFRVGTYKAAVEPLVRDNMSGRAKEQNEAWLKAMWQNYSTIITKNRELKRGALDEYVDYFASNLLLTSGDTGQLAKQSGLVDFLMTRAEFRDFLYKESGQAIVDDLDIVTFGEYLEQNPSLLDNNDRAEEVVAVIVAEGAIVGGKQSPGTIGSETMCQRLRKARKDDAVKAVVLRINSGGGSAFFSEIIRQEILEVKKAGKPVVVSMGAVAASGGYWIAAAADKIFATPTTLTGSIGIFGAIPSFEKSLDAVGVHSDGVATSSLVAASVLGQPMPKQVKEAIQLSVEFGYNRFLDVVAQGRDMAPSRVNEIGQGRVYSGKKALSLGLVDEIGTLRDAVFAAAEMAGIEKSDPMYIEKKSTFSEMLFRQFVTVSRAVFPGQTWLASLVTSLFGSGQNGEKALSLFSDPHHVYAVSEVNFTF